MTELWDTSEKGRKIWKFLDDSERLGNLLLLEEAGRLLFEQAVRDPFDEEYFRMMINGDRSSLIEEFGGEENLPQALRDYWAETPVTQPPPSAPVLPNAVNYPSFTTQGVRPELHPEPTNNPLAYRHASSITPSHPQLEKSYPHHQTPHTISSNFYSSGGPAQNLPPMPASNPLRQLAPAPQKPQPMSTADTNPPILSENANTPPLPTAEMKKQRSVERGQDIFKAYGVHR